MTCLLVIAVLSKFVFTSQEVATNVRSCIASTSPQVASSVPLVLPNVHARIRNIVSTILRLVSPVLITAAKEKIHVQLSKTLAVQLVRMTRLVK